MYLPFSEAIGRMLTEREESIKIEKDRKVTQAVSHVRAHMCVRPENKQTIMKQKEKKRERMDTEFTSYFWL